MGHEEKGNWEQKEVKTQREPPQMPTSYFRTGEHTGHVQQRQPHSDSAPAWPVHQRTLGGGSTEMSSGPRTEQPHPKLAAITETDTT